MSELQWLCMRKKGHDGEHLTAGSPMGIKAPDRCGVPGARFVEKAEIPPKDLFLYDHGIGDAEFKLAVQRLWDQGMMEWERATEALDFHIKTHAGTDLSLPDNEAIRAQRARYIRAVDLAIARHVVMRRALMVLEPANGWDRGYTKVWG